LDIPFTDFISFLVNEAPDILPASMIADEMAFYDNRLDDIYNGSGWGIENAKYGDIYWFTEDCSFFRLTADKDRFFAELEELLGEFLHARDIVVDPNLLSEVIRYQWLRVPGADEPAIQQWQFNYNIPEYMEKIVTADPVEIKIQSQVLFIAPVDYNGDFNLFALEHVIYGRKNDNVLWPAKWYVSDSVPFEEPNETRLISSSSKREGIGVW
jgi:hypothetical protein